MTTDVKTGMTTITEVPTVLCRSEREIRRVDVFEEVIGGKSDARD